MARPVPPAPVEPRPDGVAVASRAFRERATGVVEVRMDDGVRRLVFVGGELHLPSDHPLAGHLAGLLPRVPGAVVADAERLRGLMARIAFLVTSWSGGEARFVAEPATGPLVGPLPTVLLAMEWAAARGTQVLLTELGGEGATLAAVEPVEPVGPAAAAARLLDPHAAVLLARLARPTTVADLVRQGGSRGRVLADLARLRAAGLVRQAAPAADPPVGAEGGAVAREVLRRYAERLGRDLASRPLALDADSHRSHLADLLTRAPALDAYDLLGVGLAATDEEIHVGFERVARLAHPSHAARLGGAAGEADLWGLFERATAAYLTLSQPERRRRYTEKLGRHPPVPRDGSARPAEERQLARSYYERAEALIEAEDFHFAVELLKQAVQTHPRPEYYVLLGQVQSRNPRWLRHALDSYRRAVELGAEAPRLAVALGRICEELEQPEEARRHYQAALARDPADTDARAGLARLGPDPTPRRFPRFGRRP